MPATHYFLRYGSVNGKSFLAAIKHNRREILKEHGATTNIDPTRTYLNYSLGGLETATDIDRYAKSLIALAGISKVRKNAVWAVEIIFSLPINWHLKETKHFFQDCYKWTLKSFEGTLLSFDVHLDETAPHAHALILPLINGKMQGDMLKGDRKKMYERRNLYNKEIAANYGLISLTKQRLNKTEMKVLAKEVMEQLKDDSIQSSVIFPCIRDSIFANPLPYAQLLGITQSISTKRVTKFFIDIKRSKGRGSFIH